MNRRQFLASLGGSLVPFSLTGCAGVFPTGDDETGEYPGGSLLIENTGDSQLEVSISVVEERFTASLDTSVPAGETVVERSFVTASAGEVVTLAAQIGSEGDPTTFEFLPAGGEDTTPPEVARLSITNAVEDSTTWTATQGTSE